MLLVVKFSVDLVPRVACAVFVLLRDVFGLGIASLNHETFDDAMKGSAVIESLARQLLEVFHRFWRHIGPELGHHFARGGLYYRHFIGCSRSGLCFLWLLFFLFFLILGKPRRNARHHEREP